MATRPLKEFVVTYRIGDAPLQSVRVHTATRGAAIEAVTAGTDALCAHREIISVYSVNKR